MRITNALKTAAPRDELSVRGGAGFEKLPAARARTTSSPSGAVTSATAATRAVAIWRVEPQVSTADTRDSPVMRRAGTGCEEFMKWGTDLSLSDAARKHPGRVNRSAIISTCG